MATANIVLTQIKAYVCYFQSSEQRLVNISALDKDIPYLSPFFGRCAIELSPECA